MHVRGKGGGGGGDAPGAVVTAVLVCILTVECLWVTAIEFTVGRKHMS